MHRSCKISGLADALTERGIVRPSPIQQLAMPKLAQGCLATERCIGLYYRYINVVCIWCIHVFQRKKHAQKKTIHWNCMGMLQTNPFSYPLKWTMEMANYIIVMKLIVYIYIYISSKYRLTKLATFRMAQPFPPRSRRWAYHRPCAHRGWEDLGLSPADAGETSAAWANWGIHKWNIIYGGF